MKTYFLILFFASALIFGQFKNADSHKIPIKESIGNTSVSNFFLGFLNSENFSMHHSVGMSYTSGGGYGVALGVYTNSMFFRINKDLNIQVDASLVNTPYNTLGDSFTKDINGIYLSRASLNWHLAKDMNLYIEYRGGPTNYSPFGYYGYGNYPTRERLFDRDWYEK